MPRSCGRHRSWRRQSPGGGATPLGFGSPRNYAHPCLARASLMRAALLASSCPATPAAPEPRPYARHRPETTALYLVVREHLETFLSTVREERGKDLPRYVEEELRRYLRCGILAHGFCRVACRVCHQEILVAYACKCRGSCPSCSARRMKDAS